MTAAPAAMAAAMLAACSPASAAASAVPPASSAAARLAASSAPNTAIPMAPPIWAVADARPELTPEFRAAMPSAMTSVVGVKLNATPVAATTSAGRTRSRYESPLSTVASRRCATDEQHEPDDRHPLGSEPVECPRQNEDADREPRERCREHGEAGDGRAVLEDLLQQQGDEHETGDAGAPAEEVHRDPTAHAGVAEHAACGRIGSAARFSTRPNPIRHSDGDDSRADDLHRDESAVRRRQHSEHDGDRRAGEKGRAGRVERALRRLPFPRGGAPSPATPMAAATAPVTKSTLCQPSAAVRSPPTVTPAAPPTVEAAPQPLIARTRAGPVKRGEDDRHGGRAQHRRTRSLDQPGRDQQRVGRREPAEQRAGDEHAGAEEEHPAPPEDVRGAARDQQQSPEGEEVGVQDPGGSDGGEAEVGRDGRQRDVQDAGVEHHHELRSDQGEDERQSRGLRMCNRLQHLELSRARECRSRGCV